MLATLRGSRQHASACCRRLVVGAEETDVDRRLRIDEAAAHDAIAFETRILTQRQRGIYLIARPTRPCEQSFGLFLLDRVAGGDLQRVERVTASSFGQSASALAG